MVPWKENVSRNSTLGIGPKCNVFKDYLRTMQHLRLTESQRNWDRDVIEIVEGQVEANKLEAIIKHLFLSVIIAEIGKV